MKIIFKVNLFGLSSFRWINLSLKILSTNNYTIHAINNCSFLKKKVSPYFIFVFHEIVNNFLVINRGFTMFLFTDHKLIDINSSKPKFEQINCTSQVY